MSFLSRLTALFLFSLCLFAPKSQTYIQANSEIGLSVLNNWGIGGAGVCFFDFDEDGWDDLSICTNGQSPVFFRNNGDGTFQSLNFFFNVNQIKHITWVDFDNDGDNDLFITRFQASPVLLRNEGNFNFTDITMSAGIIQNSARYFGHAWGDYNRDGYLDLYLCNYDNILSTDRNYFYENNGDGTFTEKAIALGIDNANRPSFQASWFDYNSDGRPDLYITNESISHPNFLYRNNGDGTFTSVGAATLAGITIDAKSISVGDYNRDGHFDLYISNTSLGNRLLRNTGNDQFQNMAGANGALVNSNCWGTNWPDFNNDGHIDLFVATGLFPGSTPAVNVLFENDGTGTFLTVPDSGFQTVGVESYGSAIGDFNNDGFPDILINNRAPSTAALWRCVPNENNWIKLSLHGTVSNRNAIGSTVSVYSGVGTQHHHYMCGSDYLGQNSQHVLFGLGQFDSVDSVMVKWPSGLSETYYDLQGLQNHDLIEGTTIQPLVTGPPVLCPGDTAYISIPGYGQVQWNDGSVSDSLMVTEPGDYSGIVLVGDTQSPLAVGSITISFAESPAFETELSHPECFGSNNGSISLFFESDDVSVLWTTGNTGPFLTELEDGEYHATFVTPDGCAYESDFLLSSPSEISVTFSTTDATCFGEQDGTFVLFSSTGGTGIVEVLYEFEPTSLSAGSYSLIAIDENGCDAEFSFEIFEPDALDISLLVEDTDEFGSTGVVLSVVSGGSEPYTYLWSNGQQTENIEGLGAGVYGLWVVDANGCESYTEATINIISRVGEMPETSHTLIPNPFGSNLRFFGRDGTEVRITSADGQVVFNKRLQNLEIISTDEWASGIYFVRTIEGQIERWEKLIKH